MAKTISSNNGKKEKSREKRSRKEANARAQAAAVKYVLPGVAVLTFLLVVVLFLLSYRSKPSLEL